MVKWIVAVVVAGSLMWTVSSYYSAYDYGSNMDNQAKAQYEQMENVQANYALKVQEAVQVPGMKTDDLSRVMREAFEGRYGEDGSKAAFQWIQENYPGQVSDALYSKVQVIIEAGRNQFQNEQKLLIDIKRQYQTVLDNDPLFTMGWWLKTVGFPKKDLAEYKIISSAHAKKSFDTGIDEGLQLR